MNTPWPSDGTKSMIWQRVNRNLLKLLAGKPKFAQITLG